MNTEATAQRPAELDVERLVDRTTRYIVDVQERSGAIPWFVGSIVDPWDHVEAAMGLTIGGKLEEASRAYYWLASTQEVDGSWFAAYQHGKPADVSRVETNFVAYVATGVWHYFLVTQDTNFLHRMWPTVARAMEYVLALQTEFGEIYWAVDRIKGIDRDALVTGCCSIYKSLECAISIAEQIQQPTVTFATARTRLGTAIRTKPERFDRTWESKSRYSMDWFYPVLSGAIGSPEALKHLDARWHEFVEAGVGCRCVNDEPWVTIAETCELIMALCAIGEQARAKNLFLWIQRFQYTDGSWWTGFVTRDETLWPDERPTWTAGAVLLAADMIHELTPGHRLFTTQHHSG